MKKGLLILVALSIALLMGASMLFAQEKATAEKEKGSCGKEMKMGAKEMGECGKEMKLTDEQKTKLEELKMNFRLKMIDLKAERAKLGIMLKKEMMKPEPAMKDIEVVVKKMSAVRETCMLAGIEHMLAMRKILGPDACKGMQGGMGMGCGMMGMQGMSCCDDEEGCMMMGGEGRGMGGMRGMPGMRMMRMKGAGCEKEEGEGCAAEGMKGGCTMGKDEAAGCAKECAGKKIECKVEVKEVKEEAKKK
jgi:Spy/CpxP family protein refolding chaperone